MAATPVNSLLALLAVGIALSLPAAGYSLLGGLGQLSASAPTTPQISLFMKLQADREAAKATRLRLEKHPGVLSVDFLPRESTLERMKSRTGMRDAIEILGGNPFPDAFVVNVRDQSTAGMEGLATQFRAWPEVDHVQLDSAWARRVEAIFKLGRSIVLLLALLLGCGIVAICFSIVRMQVLTQRAEVEVSRLLGATDGYIRLPYLYQGGLFGLLGAAMAWLLVLAASLVLRAPAAELAGLYGLNLTLGPLGGVETGALVLSSCALGWVGAFFSLNQSMERG